MSEVVRIIKEMTELLIADKKGQFGEGEFDRRAEELAEEYLRLADDPGISYVERVYVEEYRKVKEEMDELDRKSEVVVKVFCNRCGGRLEVTGRPVLSGGEVCYMVEVCPVCCEVVEDVKPRITRMYTNGATDGHGMTRNAMECYGMTRKGTDGSNREGREWTRMDWE
jgi:hypothetical protein